MAQKYIFSTVNFGGFDKEEVLEYIKTTIDEYEAQENTYKTTIKELQKRIEKQKAQIGELNKRNSELSAAVNAVSNKTVKTSENNFDKETIADALIFTKQSCDRLLAKTKQQCSNMITSTEAECRHKKIMLYAGNEQSAEKYERRLEVLLDNMNTLLEVNDLVYKKTTALNEDLKKTHERMLSELTPEPKNKHE